jgi:type I restriction enzyme S subunit
VAQPGISVGVINEMYLPLPPLSLQQSFATKIEAIEKQKELIKRSIAEVETLLASRMQHYFG